MPIFELLRTRATVTWIVLIAATAVSYLVGVEHATGSAIGMVLLGIAFLKVRFVGLDFMELRNAPLPLRGLFECYCVAAWAVLAGMYSWT